MTGSVSHVHGVLTIDAADLLLPGEDDRDAIMSILGRLAAAKGEEPAVPMIEAHEDAD